MFIIPNAGQAIGSPYDVLDQAEPDAVDFEALGNIGANYVVSGGAVTTNGSATNVAVAAATVVVAGHVFSMAAAPSLAIPSPPVNKRFDLVVARLTAGVVSAFVITGADSATNPTYPLSSAVVVITAATNFNSLTDVFLGALYRPGGGVVTAARIADKRSFGTTVVSAQSGSTPTATGGTSQAGVLNYKTGTPSGTSTGLFVGDVNGNWTEAAANVPGPYLPIGGVLGWPSRQAVPTNILECNGQSLATSSYPALFALLGYDYGGGGASFNLPNYNNVVLKGTTQTATGQTNSPGALIGSDLITLTAGQIPTHTHNVSPPSTTLSISDPGHQHIVTAYAGAAGGAPSAPYWSSGQSLAGTFGTSASTTGISGTVSVATFTSAGNNGAAGTQVSTVPASTFIRWIIRVF